MRTFALALLLSSAAVSTAAASPFRDTPPVAMKLLAAADTPLSAPPLVDSSPSATPPQQKPGGLGTAKKAPPPAAAPSPDAAVEIKVDPYAGTFVGKEVAVGAALVLATDIACVLAGGLLGVGLVAATGGLNSSESVLIGIAVGAALFSLVDVAVAPLMAAVGAYSMAPHQGNNGLLGGALGAYVVQGATIVIGLIGYAVIAVALFATGGVGTTTPSSAFTFGYAAVEGIFGLLGLGLHYVGLPMGASLGIHWSGAVNSKKQTSFTRRPEILAGRPDELYARTPTRALSMPLAAFVF